MDKLNILYRDLLYGAYLQAYWSAKCPEGFGIEFTDDKSEYARRFFGRLLSTYVSSGQMDMAGVSEETIGKFCEEFGIESPDILEIIVPLRDGSTVVAKSTG